MANKSDISNLFYWTSKVSGIFSPNTPSPIVSWLVDNFCAHWTYLMRFPQIGNLDLKSGFGKLENGPKRGLLQKIRPRSWCIQWKFVITHRWVIKKLSLLSFNVKLLLSFLPKIRLSTQILMCEKTLLSFHDPLHCLVNRLSQPTS